MASAAPTSSVASAPSDEETLTRKTIYIQPREAVNGSSQTTNIESKESEQEKRQPTSAATNALDRSWTKSEKDLRTSLLQQPAIRLSLTRLRHCAVYANVVPSDAHIQQAYGCRIFLGHVRGKATFSDLQDCIVLVGSNQVSIRNCHNCVFSVGVFDNLELADSGNISFLEYHGEFENQSKTLRDSGISRQLQQLTEDRIVFRDSEDTQSDYRFAYNGDLFEPSGSLAPVGLFTLSSLFDRYVGTCEPFRHDPRSRRSWKETGYTFVCIPEHHWNAGMFNQFQHDLAEDGVSSDGELDDLIRQFPRDEVYPYSENFDDSPLLFSFDLLRRLYEVQGFEALSTDLEKLKSSIGPGVPVCWKIRWNPHFEQDNSSGLSVSSSQELRNKLGEGMEESIDRTLMCRADACLQELKESLQAHPDLYGKLRSKVLSLEEEKQQRRGTSNRQMISASEFAQLLECAGAHVSKPVSVLMLLRMGGSPMKQTMKIRENVSPSQSDQHKAISIHEDVSDIGEGAGSDEVDERDNATNRQRHHLPSSKQSISLVERNQIRSSSRISAEQLLNAFAHFRRSSNVIDLKKWRCIKQKQKRENLEQEKATFHRALKGNADSLSTVSKWDICVIRQMCGHVGGLSEGVRKSEAAMEAAEYLNSNEGKASLQKQLIHLKRYPEEAPDEETRALSRSAAAREDGSEKQLLRKIKYQRFEERFNEGMNRLSGNTDAMAKLVTEFLASFRKSNVASTFEEWLQDRFKNWREKQQNLKNWFERKSRSAAKASMDAQSTTLLSVIEERLRSLVNRATVETTSGGVIASIPVREGLELHSRLRKLQKLAHQKNNAVHTGEQIITKGEFDEVMHPLLESLVAYPATSKEAKILLDTRGVARKKVSRMASHSEGIKKLCHLCGREYSEEFSPENLPDDLVEQSEDLIYSRLLSHNACFSSSDASSLAASKNFEDRIQNTKGAYDDWLKQKRESQRASKERKRQEEIEKEKQQREKRKANKKAYKRWKRAAAKGMYISRVNNNQRRLVRRLKPGEGIPELPAWQHVCAEEESDHEDEDDTLVASSQQKSQQRRMSRPSRTKSRRAPPPPSSTPNRKPLDKFSNVRTPAASASKRKKSNN
eukprot:gb/GECG01012518.1/.p1 GENE.gb/GECG01012518.1/~~gb/GECG01012518.1/.p1  ORF type:complete len:1114 (+),score=175.67 gb/GECG01012518.1/:1-3342(+)